MRISRTWARRSPRQLMDRAAATGIHEKFRRHNWETNGEPELLRTTRTPRRRARRAASRRRICSTMEATAGVDGEGGLRQRDVRGVSVHGIPRLRGIEHRLEV